MFVKLIDGPEPTIVNSDQVALIEGIDGGRRCRVHFHDRYSIVIDKPADDVQALLDWAAPVKEKRDGKR